MRSERKIHWKCWKASSQSKKEGVMGFRDIRCFNLTMLAKHGWRLLQKNGSLLKCPTLMGDMVKLFEWLVDRLAEEDTELFLVQC